MNLMENLGSDFNQTGSVMTPQELAAMRKKRGECVSCGQKCFKKKVFKMIPLDIPGLVKEGRCLKCTGDGPVAPRGPASGGRLAPPPPGGLSTSARSAGPLTPAGATGPRVNRPASMPATLAATAIAGGPRTNSMPPPRPAVPAAGPARSNSNRSMQSTGSGSKPIAAAPIATAAIAAPPASPPMADAAAYNDYDDDYDAGGGASTAGYSAGFASAPDPYSGGGGNSYNDSPPPSDLPPIPPSREPETTITVLGNHANVTSTKPADATHTKDELKKAIKLLDDSMDKPEDLEKAMEEFATMTLIKADHSYMIDQRVPRTISKAMSANLDNIHLQKWGCSAVFNLAATARCQEYFVKGGIMDPILTTMEKNMNDAAFQEQALSTIANLAAAKKNLDTLVTKGGLTRIVEAMNAHTGNPKVLAKACAAVANMAAHDESSHQKKLMEDAGGTIVIAMVMNPNHVELLESALRALRHLSATSDDNKTEIANNGGVDSIISAMQVHRDVAGVQLEGAWTLCNLATTGENKEVIGDCGGIDVVVRGLWVHAEERRVLEKCLRALYNLSLDAHNAGIVIEVGGINAIVTVMQAHTDAPGIQEVACGILNNLGDVSNDNRMQIVDEEALDALVLTMVLHSEDAEVMKRACIALKCLCIPDNFKPMFAANIVELVTVAGEKFPDCKPSMNFILSQMDGDDMSY